MLFVLLTFLAAFLIEGLGTIVSVIGLSALFGSNPIIISLAVALDIGKIAVVSLLYTHWATLSRTMKAYGLVAATVTMVITSAGAAGYLTGQFQQAIVGTQEIGVKVEALKQEQVRLEARKKQIDDQIANLPANLSRARVTLARQFEQEQQAITTRLAQITQELPTLQVTQLSADAKAGPVVYISKAFDVPVEEAVKWVVLLIIFVFDPLAVFLIIAGNFLWVQHKRGKEDVVVPEVAEAVVEKPEKPLPAERQLVEVVPEPPVVDPEAPVVDVSLVKPKKVKVKVVAEAPAEAPPRKRQVRKAPEVAVKKAVEKAPKPVKKAPVKKAPVKKVVEKAPVKKAPKPVKKAVEKAHVKKAPKEVFYGIPERKLNPLARAKKRATDKPTRSTLEDVRDGDTSIETTNAPRSQYKGLYGSK